MNATYPRVAGSTSLLTRLFHRSLSGVVEWFLADASDGRGWR